MPIEGVGRQEVSRCRTRGTHTPPPSANKATHSGFETQSRRHQKSQTRVSVALQKRIHVLQTFFKQEGIPVGCVPSAHCPSWGGGVWCIPEEFFGGKEIEKKRRKKIWRTPPKIGDTPPQKKFGESPYTPRPPACKNITLAQLRCGR